MKNLNKSKKIALLIAVCVFQLLLVKTTYAQLNFKQDSLFCKQQPTHLKINLKQYILPGSAMFLSGLLDGTIESIKFHYENGFKYRFKHANDQFWNPDVSWKNKYKNGKSANGPKFCGSTTIFVGTTDAYHGLRTAKNLINTFTVVFYINRTRKDIHKVKFKKILLDALILTAIRNIGFTATYDILFKPHNL